MTDATEGVGQRTHRENLIVISGLVLGMLLAALDQTIVSTALPTIVGDLKGATHLSWVVTAYLLTSTIATPLYGKISDLYGRKRIYLIAISLFLAGSALCGIAQNMGQLIAFRAIQGLGAGGLMTLAFTIIGDVLPPRERGRYMGYFGAVFGLSSVIGPLVGGTLTDHADWRWIFYVNIPIGLIALAVIALNLHLPVKRTEHRLDLAGAALIAAGITALLLVSVWGGGHPGDGARSFTGYAWSSPEIIGLLLVGLASIALFLWQESRHPEPIVPLNLFRDSIFSVCVGLSFLSGAVLFGAVIFLPQFQQIVKGFSPTESGLLMVPLTIGVVIGSTGSGRLIAKLGRYRMFPIIGAALLTLGFYLLSHVSVETSQFELALWMLVTGFGMGTLIPVTTLAVQNAVEPRHLGAATATVIFFRTLGGAFGTAIFGAILNNRVAYNLPKLLPTGSSSGPDLDSLQPETVATLPPAVQHAILESFARALHVVFLWGIPAAACIFLVALLLKDKPLKSRDEAPPPVVE